MKSCMLQCKNVLVAHKKKIYSIVILAVLIGAIAVGAHAMFRVSGVVTDVSNNSITVSNFFRTQTVDLTGAPVNVAQIKVGEKVMIQKNLQGDILYVRTHFDKKDGHRHERKQHE